MKNKLLIAVFFTFLQGAAFAVTSWTGPATVVKIHAAECPTASQSIVCFNLSGIMSGGALMNLCYYSSSPMANIFLSKAETAMSTGMKLDVKYENTAGLLNCAMSLVYKINEIQLLPAQ